MKKRTLTEYLENYEYVPKFMKDFDTQRDLFMAIQELYSEEPLDPNKDNQISRMSHIYTIDYFLRFMATHGYALQKVRNMENHVDIKSTLEYFQEKWKLEEEKKKNNNIIPFPLNR